MLTSSCLLLAGSESLHSAGPSSASWPQPDQQALRWSLPLRGCICLATLSHCVLACRVLDVLVVRLLVFIYPWLTTACPLIADAVSQGIARQRQAIVNGLRESVSSADMTACH